MQFKSAALSTALLVAVADAFVTPNAVGLGNNYIANDSFRPLSSLTASDNELDLGMTPELKRVTDAFAAIEQEQVRYKQLLYMAQTTKEVNSLSEASKVPENKVPGCLSTVYVDGSAEYNEEMGDYVVNFLGDSDGLMTKGLVALLVRWVTIFYLSWMEKKIELDSIVCWVRQKLSFSVNNLSHTIIQNMDE